MKDADAVVQRIVEIAQSDTPEGFTAFYTLIHGDAPPDHARDWIRQMCNLPEDKIGAIIEAFRGSTKTTTSNTWIAWQIGIYPERANLLIQVGDDIAADNTSMISSIIEYNPKWKWIFPHVVPDKDKGWGAGGYQVKRDDIEYGEWERINSDRKDPTLLGVGYKSRSIIGKHPDGVLVIDDICDENNTSSLRELDGLHKKLQANIIPIIEPTTKVMFIGTPWTDNDALAYVKATGQFHQIKTPVMQNGVLTWPEKYTEEEIEKQKKLAGEVEFARMFLLDLEKSKGHVLKREWLRFYPATEIKPDWPRFMGVDYASVSDKTRRQMKDRDYFCIAVGCVTPQGTMIVEDGFMGRVSQAEAEQRLVAMASAFPTLQQIGIEAIGKGEEFYSLMMAATEFLPIMPIPSHTGEARSKGGRFEKILARMFQRGSILLSDKMTPFLQSFISQWISWDGSGVSHDDALDAVYMMIKAAEGYIAIPHLQATTRSPMYQPRIRQKNPWAVNA